MSLRRHFVAASVLAVFFVTFAAFPTKSAHAVSTPSVVETPLPIISEAPPDFSDSQFAVRIDALIQKCPGEPSVVILSADGRILEHRSSEIIRAASLIKLPIMAALFSMRIDLTESVLVTRGDRTGGSGSLKSVSLPRLFTAEKLVDLMIVESDNTATNALIRHFGREKIEEEFNRIGLRQTRLPHRILESGEDNPTTAREIAELLTRFDGLVGADAMRLYLSRTINNRRLARYLPDGSELAHKTGTLKSVVHDAGIMKTDRGDVVIVALIKQPKSWPRAERWLADLGKTVYENF